MKEGTASAASDRAPALPLRGALAVVPAYREQEVIGGVVSELRASIATVVVVDDGSPDRTAERALEAGAIVLRHPLNRGQGAALQTGIAFALREGADFIVTFDADGQHRPRDAVALVAALRREGAEVAFGNRFAEHARSVPTGRRLLLRLAVLFSRAVTGVRLGDAHNGLRAFTATAAARLRITLDGMAHASEIAEQVHRSGLAWLEVPVEIRYTDYSRGKGQRWSAAPGVAADYLLGRLLR